MREIDLGVHPVPLKDNLYRRAMIVAGRRYVQSEDLPQPVRDFLVEVVLPSTLNGEKRSIAEDSKELLKPYEPNVKLESNIPKSGPVLFVANHWQEGPATGNWTHILISREVAKRREDSSRDIKWIMNGDMYLPTSGLKMPYSNNFLIKLADTYSQHVVGKNGTVDGGLKIIHSFKQGDLIGLYPEAEFSTNLKRGNPNAGFIASALARSRPNGIVCPVGVYSRGIELHAIFGEPFRMTEILERSYPLPADPRKKEAVCQRIAGYLMKKINPLVPEAHQLKEIN